MDCKTFIVSFLIYNELNNNLTSTNANVSNLSNNKSDRYFKGAVGSSFAIPDGTSEVIVTVAVNSNPEIFLQCHWTNQHAIWFGDDVAFRMLAKSKTGTDGIEYAAVVIYNKSKKLLSLASALLGSTDVTATTTVTYAYR